MMTPEQHLLHHQKKMLLYFLLVLDQNGVWLDNLVGHEQQNLQQAQPRDRSIVNYEFNGYTPPTDESIMGDFQKFFINQASINPSEKVAYCLLMVAASGTVPACSLQNEPYGSFQKYLNPILAYGRKLRLQQKNASQWSQSATIEEMTPK